MSGGLRAGNEPLAFHVCLGLPRHGILHAKVTDHRIICRRYLLLGVADSAPPGRPVGDRHFHVGLSRADPYFTHDDVVNRERVLPGDRHLERPARRHWRELGSPAALGIR